MRWGRRTPAKLLLPFALLTWAISAFLAIRHTATVRIQAGQFLTDVKQLRAGESRIDQVTSLMSKYHVDWIATNAPPVHPPALTSIFSHHSEFPENTSGPGIHRRVDFVFDNRWQHWLCFSPFTFAFGTVWVKNNMVDSYSTGLIAFRSFNGAIDVTESPRSVQSETFSVHRKNGLHVRLTAAATSEQRAAAYDFNLGCLTRLRGCGTIGEVAPRLSQLLR